MTYGDLISSVVNGFNSTKKDMRIPKRYILSVFKKNAEFIMSQKLRDRSIYREEDLFTWLNCIELKKEDIIKCSIVEFKSCKSLMKTKKKLPKILSSIFGYAILMVTTIDGDKEYKVKTLSSYNTLKRRKSFDKFKGNYVYIKDGYLYIPDSEVEAVNILLLTLDEDSDEMSECGDPNLGCISIWDRVIKVADKILTPIIQQTLQEISMRFNIPIDENSNLDVNIKTQER